MDDGGLITPVLQNADQTDIYSLSRNWKALVERARAKQLQPEEYNTGTFTLSNLGMFGVDRFDAILPPGQGCYLGDRGVAASNGGNGRRVARCAATDAGQYYLRSPDYLRCPCRSLSARFGEDD